MQKRQVLSPTVQWRESSGNCHQYSQLSFGRLLRHYSTKGYYEVMATRPTYSTYATSNVRSLVLYTLARPRECGTFRFLA